MKIPFVFYDRVIICRNEGFYSKIDCNVSNVHSFIDNFYASISSPAYYSNNWSALEDDLGNLEWIKENEVNIVHDGVPGIEIIHLETYIDILVCAVNFWNKKTEHKLNVFFPINSKNRICSIYEKKYRQKFDP